MICIFYLDSSLLVINNGPPTADLLSALPFFHFGGWMMVNAGTGIILPGTGIILIPGSGTW